MQMKPQLRSDFFRFGYEDFSRVYFAQKPAGCGGGAARGLAKSFQAWGSGAHPALLPQPPKKSAARGGAEGRLAAAGPCPRVTLPRGAAPSPGAGSGSALPARPPRARKEWLWGCALPPEWLAAAAPEPSLGRS